MIQVSLESLTNSAETRREVYFDCFHEPDILGSMSLKVKERHNVQITPENFDLIIEESLARRGINYLSDFKPLDRKEIAILGETYHFVHKFGLRNHDYRNPVPLLKQTLEALKSIDNEYAAKLLYSICSLTPKDSKERYSDMPRIVNFFEKILPALFEEYKNGLKQIEGDKGNEEKYRHEKSSVDSFYKKSLDIAFELLVESVKRKVEFYWDSLQRTRERRKIIQDFRTVYVINNSQ